MSNEYNDAILEQLFEEGLELYKGDEKKAEKYARKRFEDLPEPDYKAEGGEAVPSKYKGFAKLPESVQQRMDPKLARQYRYGGEATNSGQKVSGRAKGGCRGMGAALRGGKFVGVR
jgi:hypothetical protein